MKLLSRLMKLLHSITLPSQQFCFCGTLFNVHDTFMKHALRLALHACMDPLLIHGNPERGYCSVIAYEMRFPFHYSSLPTLEYCWPCLVAFGKV